MKEEVKLGKCSECGVNLDEIGVYWKDEEESLCGHHAAKKGLYEVSEGL